MHVPVQMPRQGCFIATATYGSAFTEELDYFQSFRDSFLLADMVGTDLVQYYYRLSSMFTEVIAHSERRSFSVRIFLDKILQTVIKSN